MAAWAAPPARAAGTVGSGTPGSCTEAALNAALAGGGTVTFNCGGGPVVIPITSTKVLSSSTTIDGTGQQVTLDGGGTTKMFLTTYQLATGLNLVFRRAHPPERMGFGPGGGDRARLAGRRAASRTSSSRT